MPRRNLNAVQSVRTRRATHVVIRVNDQNRQVYAGTKQECNLVIDSCHPSNRASLTVKPIHR
jgi:hypothetical protein